MAEPADPGTVYQQRPDMHRVCVHCNRSRDSHYFFSGRLRCAGTEDERRHKAQIVAQLIEDGAEFPIIAAKLRIGRARVKSDLLLAHGLRVAHQLWEWFGHNPSHLALLMRRLADLITYLESEK